MASNETVNEAAARFVNQLDVEPDVAARLVRLVKIAYVAEIETASEQELFEAAVWAADRLRQRYAKEELSVATTTEIRDSLTDSLCPLCASSGNDRTLNRLKGGGERGGMPSPSGASA
jgi:Asp-tRNA(Asn)/Glu-tRNA(Gln) amidotransferase B subunit